jgi:murein DD-endopeptidase MepM/ murein hydrolase activator NlpD
VSKSYVGRHRPALKPSRGRQFVVPVALLSTTVAGGLVVRQAGASELSPEAAAMKNVSNTVAGLGLAADPSAVAAAAANRSGARSSRDLARDAKTLIVSATMAGADTAAEAKAQADEAAAEQAAQAKAKADAKKKRALALAHRWVIPVSSYTLTSGFGFRWGKMHPAQDLACPVGTPVHALSSGKVIFAGWSNEGYGYKVEIRYWDGTVSWYGHMSLISVRVGDDVRPGDKLGAVGSTGHSTGPHLHLEIHPDGGPAVNPQRWLAEHGLAI